MTLSLSIVEWAELWAPEHNSLLILYFFLFSFFFNQKNFFLKQKSGEAIYTQIFTPNQAANIYMLTHYW